MPIDGAVRGVAGSGGLLFAAIANDSVTTVQAYRGGTSAWRTEIAGNAGVLAAGEQLVAASVSLTATASAQARPATPSPAAQAPVVRGDPGAAVIGLDTTSGAKRWTTLFDSTDWAIVTAIAPLGNDFIVGGSFGGTLRAGARVVSTAGGSDGFVARVAANGAVTWLIRLGGAFADGVQGVATRGDHIAIAGTFTTTAELGGVALPAYDDRSTFGDCFAAELDSNGARRWASTFGGRGDDEVAGVAIDGRGNTIVAANAREVVHVGSAQLVTQGPSDGVLVWFREGGETGPGVLVGGMDFDGLRAIAPLGDDVVVGGFFSGSIKLGGRALTAGGGDDAFLAAYDSNGTVATTWHVGGDGREEITSLAAIAGGFVAGIAHTANASIDGEKLPAPGDPMRGGALVVRGAR